jgi:hypothetical protein
LVKNKAVTGFSDSEEEAVKSNEIGHFLLKDEIRKLEGLYSNGPDWGANKAAARWFWFCSLNICY